MAKTSAPPTIESLLDKGDGVLVKRNGVWTYPSAPNDRSGTNLILPTEFLADAAVQEALAKGDLVIGAVDVSGGATAVRARPDDDETPVRLVSLAHAGSVEAATELPLNSRPTHDAGRSDAEPVFLPPASIAPAGGAAVAAAPVAVPVPLKPAPAPAPVK